MSDQHTKVSVWVTPHTEEYACKECSQRVPPDQYMPWIGPHADADLQSRPR